MKSVLVILGSEESEFAKGEFNRGMFDTAVETLGEEFEVLTTIIGKGYDIDEEAKKFQKADAVIYQFPTFHFNCPSTMKKYMDEVYQYGIFFEGGSGRAYGTCGLMHKKIMLSSTWNAPESAFTGELSFTGGLSPSEVFGGILLAHKFCGFEELEHFSTHNVVVSPTFEEDKKRFVDHLRKEFNMNSRKED